MGGKDLEMLDVDAQHTAEPSLQRLKNLDSLPDLKSQIKTASEYCNHGHRAEMIVRWLTAKLQNDPKAASNVEAWNLLERCFRLVAPQKMGILLARFDLLATSKQSIQDLQEKKLLRLLGAIAKSITTLEEIASGEDGAQVKQLLSADGPSTATFLGVWLDRVSALLRSTITLGDDETSVVRMALPAMRLWTSRRPGSSDNDTFAKDCLVPCARLLRQISCSMVSSGSSKRRRGAQDGPSNETDVARDLEILVARHIFLPSRSAFFQAAEEKAPEESESELAGKLASIKAQIRAVDASQDESCDALPILLDIALRCVPMTTSRQRSKERPWVETVFQEILACLDSKGRLLSHKALSEMLKVVGKRASLPATMLKDLAQSYSGFDRSQEIAAIDYALIGEIVALDPTVFVDSVMADSLFPALTKASGSATSVTAEQQQLLVGSITEPVMRAFASSRKLENFVLRWQGQLQTKEGSTSWTVWTEVDDVMAELLEVHLTTEQIETLFDSLRAAFVPAGSSKKSGEGPSSKDGLSSRPQRASAVVLHALLKGAKSDELIERLQTRIGDLFETLLVLVETSKVKSVPLQTWLLLSLAFKLWFPTWAVKQSDAGSVSKRARNLLSHPAIDSIMKTKTSGKDVDLAVTFVGLLCFRLQAYEGCHEAASKLSARISNGSTDNFPAALLAFPGLLMLLEKDARQSLVDTMITTAIATASAESDSTEVRQAIAAFVNSAVATPHSKLGDEVLASVIEPFKSDVGSESQVAQENVVLDLLLQIPVSTLARGQRERILNWIVDLDFNSDVEESGLAKRYGIMIRLMQLPNATANIYTDPSTIWNFCRSSSSPKKSKSGKEKKSSKELAPPSLDLLAMIEGLTSLMCTYLLATQDQERSRNILKDLIDTAVRKAGSLDVSSTASCELLVVVKTILEQTSNGSTDVLSQTSGGCVQTLQAFAERVLKEAQSSVKYLKKHKDDENIEALPRVLLDLLVCLRKSNAVGKALREHDAAYEKLCKKILAKSSDESGAIVQSVRKTDCLLVPAFTLLAHIRGFEACTSLGEALLSSSIPPKDRQALVDELKQLAKASEAPNQLLVLKQIVSDSREASAQGITILQNALTSVSRTSFAKDEQDIHTLYLKLLETLRQTKDFATYTAAVSCLLTIIRDRPFILNQHLTEATLQAIQTLARPSPAERLIYLDLCALLSALLLHHRARLQGRFHLLTATLQTLQTCLFVPTKLSASQTSRALSPRHARAYTRLLTLLCNPPTRTHNNSNANNANLIDESRRARALVGQYVPTLLHSFCAQILTGSLGEGVREALTPGLWAVIEAMEVRSPEAVKTLSAGMNNSERAVLRGVYEDWKRFGKWEGA